MYVGHVGLPVRDVDRARRFYETYFGFDPATAQLYEDETVIIRNADGFDLALHPIEDVGKPQPFLHFGFHLSGRDDVGRLHDRLVQDGVEILERYDGPELVSFKCADPDGHRVEVYWEQAP